MTTPDTTQTGRGVARMDRATDGGAYYNEIDPFAAAWLRELIAAGHIAPGVVDERDIRDVRPDELAGFTQCHFFAGIGVWSYALRRAGWPDSRPVWTMSCPCQPFSAAGKGAGFADERHLWPSAYWLVSQRRPVDILGEQVASSNVDPWLDLVQADVEALGYAFGCVPLPAAGFGSPNIRDRAFWMAHVDGEAGGSGLRGGEPFRLGIDDATSDCGTGRLADAYGRDTGAERKFGRRKQRQQPRDGCAVRLDDADDARLEGFRRGHQASVGRNPAARPVAAASEPDGLADLAGIGCGKEHAHRGGGNVGDSPKGGAAGLEHGRRNHWPAPTNGFWQDADWLGCRDGKWRPVEPGTFPLAHGAAARVGRLRGYGNAINAEVATGFIEAVIDHLAVSSPEAAA